MRSGNLSWSCGILCKIYGKFQDNEEAIVLLCKYYPKDMDLEKYYEKIAEDCIRISAMQERHRILVMLTME